MNPFAFILRRPGTTLLVIGAVIGCAVFGLNKMRADEYPPGETPKIYVYMDYIGENAKHAKEYISEQVQAHTKGHEEEAHEEAHKVVATGPVSKDVVITQRYVCQIHSRKHINVCAIDNGYLEEIHVREGQEVKKGDPMFKILSVLYQARLDAENAEAKLAFLKVQNAKRLLDQKVISQNEVLLLEAELAKARAKADLAKAELNFANVVAPFDGIVDRLLQREGSLIKEGEILTTLSDNSVMWVYFNLPEKQYLEYMGESAETRQSLAIELELANHTKFSELGRIDPANGIGAIEAKFNNETGNIAFRADFSNPNRLLRHGQTGTILIKRTVKDALVIPQRATFENLAKRYVYVLDKDDVVHQREIRTLYELDDIYVIENGVLDANDRIILEGIRQVREGEAVEFEYRQPDEVLGNQKYKAE